MNFPQGLFNFSNSDPKKSAPRKHIQLLGLKFILKGGGNNFREEIHPWCLINRFNYVVVLAVLAVFLILID